MSAIVPEFRVLDSTASRTVFEVMLSPCWAVNWMFGGALAAALAKAAALSQPSRDLVPVTTDVRFLQPTSSGLALISVASVAGAGRYATARASLHVGGMMTAKALITLEGADRVARFVARDSEPAAPDASAGGGGVHERVAWSTGSRWAERDGSVPPQPFTARLAVRDPLFADGRDETAYRYLVASDLLAPPLVSRDRPLSVATVALHVSTIALCPSPWLTQELSAGEHDGEAVGQLNLSASDGRLLAHSVQRAVVRPTAAEQLPFSATGFGWGQDTTPPPSIPAPLE